MRIPVRAVDLAGETQLDYGKYENDYGSVHIWGLRAQGGVFYRNLKLLADAPIIIHDPVFTELGVGSYAASDLPDQATVLASMGTATASTVGRQTVFERRLMLQAQF